MKPEEKKTTHKRSHQHLIDLYEGQRRAIKLIQTAAKGAESKALLPAGGEFMGYFPSQRPIRFYRTRAETSTTLTSLLRSSTTHYQRQLFCLRL